MKASAEAAQAETAKTDSPAFRRSLIRELVLLHAHVLKRMPLVQVLVVAGVGFIVMPAVPGGKFLFWGLLTTGVECLRAASAVHILRRSTSFDPLKTHAFLIVLAALAGASVGAGGALFIAHLSLERQSLLVIVLFAMPAAGVSVSVGSRAILAVYALGILVPITAAYFLEHRTLWIVYGLSLLYFGFLMSVANDGIHLLERSIAIREQRDHMLAELEASNREARDATRQAEQSAQARARVLASASHDLRQPLHALSIYSAVLAAKPDPQTLNEVARNIDQIVRALGALLTGLLDLSRLSTGAYAAEWRIFALHTLATRIAEEYRAAAEARQLALSVETHPVWLRSEPLAVERILRNLLDNAIKYTERGEIRVRVRALAGQAELSVQDTGRGIAQSEQARIFEEFYQVDNPGRDRARGVGLGLAIVQRLCELIGAQIEVVSEPQQGACFSLRLPEAVAQPGGEAGPLAQPDHARLHNVPIYVIDDERDILAGMQILLSSWGVLPQLAATSEALEQVFARHGKPGCLIVDLRLEGREHGAQLASRLRAQHGPFPVLILTGETGAGVLEEARAAGYPVLHKPVAPEILHAALLAMID